MRGGENDDLGGADELLTLSGIGRSGLGDLARRHDDYLNDDATEPQP